nr:MAG TPA: hypothetical protein [Caudoviricetes sp.]
MAPAASGSGSPAGISPAAVGRRSVCRIIA